jgi:hypothetical protein
MRPPRRRERRGEPRQRRYDAGLPLHYVSVEVWAPNPAGASYPLRTAEHHVAMTPDARAFEAAIRAGLADGWFACLSAHHRYQCVPPHPGQ